ncbi:hypothetical protein A2973_01640 [Candidatus Gottesmanbacteria bacterium RIFCSPLOWO2_01_FULL_49_10]|uniref:Probable zinc-binding domain-containing protein n=1 Tax=Candidatus Gottesmanbacteria bacterium RIFCSPLOWO2_01_FULL_49_10 TaxID=1798396 RepID=A0A1F6AWV6_9BACT|nr:MAG: hypothetical protein A2973_01640 [Candidatus Gottesmanbacteria bacterium RIFCSPLOWO2_01_FULL_49_10]
MADITQTCAQCGKKFLVIEVEQEFLKKKHLPLPALCPTDRQSRRLSGRGERTLYKTTCQECGTPVITTYDPKTVTSKILCRTCYQAFFDKNDPVIP